MHWSARSVNFARSQEDPLWKRTPSRLHKSGFTVRPIKDSDCSMCKVYLKSRREKSRQRPSPLSSPGQVPLILFPSPYAEKSLGTSSRVSAWRGWVSRETRWRQTPRKMWVKAMRPMSLSNLVQAGIHISSAPWKLHSRRRFRFPKSDKEGESRSLRSLSPNIAAQEAQAVTMPGA